MKDVTKLIVGTWRLVHSITVNSDGEKEYPYGKDAIGYIHYSDAGVMAVQISRKNRGKPKDFSLFDSDYLAYFGSFEIDAEQQVVRHFVEGQTLSWPTH